MNPKLLLVTGLLAGSAHGTVIFTESFGTWSNWIPPAGWTETTAPFQLGRYGSDGYAGQNPNPAAGQDAHVFLGRVDLVSTSGTSNSVGMLSAYTDYTLTLHLGGVRSEVSSVNGTYSISLVDLTTNAVLATWSQPQAAIPADQVKQFTFAAYTHEDDHTGANLGVRIAYTGRFGIADEISLDASPASTTLPNTYFWDLDGATAGAGGAAPSGNWADPNWSSHIRGEAATAAWTPDGIAVFAAGTDATGNYAVTLAGTQSATAVKVQEGDVTLTGGTLALVTEGSLEAGSDAFLEVASALVATNLTTSGNVILSGPATVTGGLNILTSTLEVGQPLAVVGLTGAGDLKLNAASLTVDAPADTTFSGGISGAGSLIKQGPGQLTLGGNNSYLGGTSIQAGTLATANFSSLGAGPLEIAAVGTYAFMTTGGNQPAFANPVSGAGTFNVIGSGGNQSFWSGDFSGFSGSLVIGPAAGWWARGANTGSSALKVNLIGFIGLYDNEASITRTFHAGELAGGSGSRVWGQPGTANQITLSVGGANTSTTFAGIIHNNWDYDNSSTVHLTKTGSGVLALAGANTYTGDTTVTGGILAVNGTSLADTTKLVIAGGKVAPTGAETVGTLFFDGVQQAGGTWGATGSGADHIDDLHFAGADGVVNVTTSAYATWIAGFPGAAGASGFDEDADHDGIPNGAEQVLGTDPTQASAGLVQISATGNSLTFRHSQTNAPVGGVSKLYQWATDLTDWQGGGATNPGGTTVTIAAITVTDNAAPATDEIEVTATVTGTPSKRVFVRLTASQ
jgi:autotransporter-associated beta strand protein